MRKFNETYTNIVGCLMLLVALHIIVEQVHCGYGHGHGDYHGKDDYHGYYKHKPHPYKFGYEIEDGYGGKNSRHESGDGHGNVHGHYSLYDKDGRKRTVEYVADKKGFRAKIHSNEPGLTSHKAAHAYYDVEHHGYHGDHDGDGAHYGTGGSHKGGDDDGYGYHHEESYY